MEETIRRISAYKDLESNWDSYGGVPATEKSTDTAIRLVERIASVPYHISPLSGGGVYLEWTGQNNSIQIYIDGDGSIGELKVLRACRYEERRDVRFEDVVTSIRGIQ